MNWKMLLKFIDWKKMNKLAAAILICNITITSSVPLDTNTYKLHRKNVNFSFSTADVKRDLISKALDRNNNINDTQREKLLSLSNYIIENPYINEKYALYCLKNFKLKVLEEEELRERFFEAMYNPGMNTIYVNKENKGLLHEGLHVLNDHLVNPVELFIVCQQTDQSVFKWYKDRGNVALRAGLTDIRLGIGRGLNEGMTALVAHEYLNDTADVYPYDQILSKMLCEIIGSDKMLEAYTIANTNIIIDELVKIDGDKDQAIEFMRKMQRLHVIKGLYGSHRSPLEDTNNVIEIMNKYCKAKFGTPLLENKILKAYYCQLLNMDGFYVNKGYFSSKYKKIIGEPYLIFNNEKIMLNELKSPQYCKK